MAFQEIKEEIFQQDLLILRDAVRKWMEKRGLPLSFRDGTPLPQNCVISHHE